MRMLGQLAVDQPVEALETRGVAVVIYSEEDDWAVGLEADACRAFAKRMLELAADHERRFGTVRQ